METLMSQVTHEILLLSHSRVAKFRRAYASAQPLVTFAIHMHAFCFGGWIELINYLRFFGHAYACIFKLGWYLYVNVHWFRY